MNHEEEGRKVVRSPGFLDLQETRIVAFPRNKETECPLQLTIVKERDGPKEAFYMSHERDAKEWLEETEGGSTTCYQRSQKQSSTFPRKR